jgi:hypothetical protein
LLKYFPLELFSKLASHRTFIHMQSFIAAGVLVLVGIAVSVHPPYPNRQLHLMLIAVAFCLALAEAQQSAVPRIFSSRPTAAATDIILSKPVPQPTSPFRHTFDPTSGKYETKCRRILEEMFQLPFPKVRPVWLKNKTTNRRLELDCYSDQKQLALEYQGRQHMIWTPHYHKSMADLLYQKEKDAMKVRMCKEHGVTLVVVPHTVPFEQLKTYIRDQINNASIHWLETAQNSTFNEVTPIVQL